MAKSIGPRPMLDDEIVAFLRRVGSDDSPAVYVRQYAVERQIGSVTIVTVSFIADGEFCVPQEEEGKSWPSKAV